MIGLNIFDCDTTSPIGDVPDLNCIVMTGNYTAFAFQKRQATAPFSETTGLLKATWDALLSAAADTKMQIVPVTTVVLTPGENITEGGNDNTTFLGIPKNKGVGPTTVTAILEGYKASAVKAVLEGLAKHSRLPGGRTNLTFFPITDGNYAQHSNFHGIPVYNLMIQDLQKEGFKPEDRYMITFYLEPHWSLKTDYLHPVAFDLNLLKN